MNARELLRPPFLKLRRGALLAGAAGALLCAAGFFVNRGQLFQSWLFAHQFWLGLGLGGLAVLMTHHVMGGQWGVLVGRILEAMARTLPLLALLFVPLYFGMHELYSWTRPAEVAASPHLQAKAAYLNVPFFFARAAGYFAIWIVLGWLFPRWSRRLDLAPDPAAGGRLVRVGALGLVLFFFTMTFAAIDWIMSLEPEWYSTVFGAVVLLGQALQALAFACIVLHWIAETDEIRPLLEPKVLNDLGNMLMAFVIIWTYLAFIQFLVIWMGNLNEELPWMLHRSRGGWQAVGIGLIALGFFLPFLLLLFRSVKRRVAWLARVAWIIVVMRLVGTDWLIAPTFHPRLGVHWLDLAALLAIGGFWTAVFFTSLGRAALAPRHDPRMHPEVRRAMSEMKIP